jgi:hypothetical protein
MRAAPTCGPCSLSGSMSGSTRPPARPPAKAGTWPAGHRPRSPPAPLTSISSSRGQSPGSTTATAPASRRRLPRQVRMARHCHRRQRLRRPLRGTHRRISPLPGLRAHPRCRLCLRNRQQPWETLHPIPLRHISHMDYRRCGGTQGSVRFAPESNGLDAGAAPSPDPNSTELLTLSCARVNPPRRRPAMRYWRRIPPCACRLCAVRVTVPAAWARTQMIRFGGATGVPA